MIFTALASSSAGNAYTVDDGDTRILIECGISHRKLSQATGGLHNFSGCLVSHEHKDHAKAALDVLKDGIPLYMSAGTAEALKIENLETVRALEQFRVGTMEIVPFETFHDAEEPLGFLIKSRKDGQVLAFATDTVNLRYKFPGLTILAIEANFDREILGRLDKMPDKVKRRISNTHMEIDVLCDYLKGLDLTTCREIHLLHLSSATSREGHFINKVKRAVPDGIAVDAACRG